MKLTHEQEIRGQTADLVLNWRTRQLGSIENLDRDTSLEMVGYADVSLDESRIVLGRWVTAARRAGASWADIGDTLGISRQAAQQRFGGGTENPLSNNDIAKAVITREGVSAFNEVQVMEEEGRRGRKLVGCSISKLYFDETETQWEHLRITAAFAANAKIDKLTQQGWTHVATWFPFHYFRRESIG